MRYRTEYNRLRDSAELEACHASLCHVNDLFCRRFQRYGTEVISAELKNAYNAAAAANSDNNASFMSAILPPATMI